MDAPEAGEAPLYVPVEIKRQDSDPLTPRWFRLAIGVATDRIRLRSALPDELKEGPLAVRLHLPEEREGSPEALSLSAEAGETVVDAGEETERAEARLLYLRGVPEAAKDRIRGYVARRLAEGDIGGEPG